MPLARSARPRSRPAVSVITTNSSPISPPDAVPISRKKLSQPSNIRPRLRKMGTHAFLAFSLSPCPAKSGRASISGLRCLGEIGGRVEIGEGLLVLEVRVTAAESVDQPLHRELLALANEDGQCGGCIGAPQRAERVDADTT